MRTGKKRMITALTCMAMGLLIACTDANDGSNEV